MVRLCAALLAVLSLIAGCGAAQPKPQSVQTPSQQARVLTLAMQVGLEDYVQDAMALFAQKSGELSNGALTIEIKKSDDPMRELDGGAALMFAENAVIARADGTYRAFTSPFFFFNYKHLTLTLNSESFLRLTRDSTQSLLHAAPLGAFYDGNRVMLTIREETLDVVEQFEGLRISILEGDEVFYYTVRQLGAEVSQRTLEECIAGFNSGRYQTIECDTLSLESLQLPARRENVNLCDSFHAARINWLMLSEQAGQQLSEWELAVLKEAAAYALSCNDEAVLSLEQAGIEHVADFGTNYYITDQDSFYEAAKKILVESARYYNLWNWQLTDEIRSIVY